MRSAEERAGEERTSGRAGTNPLTHAAAPNRISECAGIVACALVECTARLKETPFLWELVRKSLGPKLMFTPSTVASK